MAGRIRKGWWLFVAIAMTLGGCSNESPVSSEEVVGSATGEAAPVDERGVPPIEKSKPRPAPDVVRKNGGPPAGAGAPSLPEPDYAPAPAAPPPERIDPDVLWESFSRRSDNGSGADGANGGSGFGGGAFESGARRERAPASEPEFAEEMAAPLPVPENGLPRPAPPPVVEALPDAAVEVGVEEVFRDQGTHHLVQVFFATDRKLSDSDDPAERFGAERGVLTYGICEVSIPRGHQTGELEAPRWWRLEFSEDPAQHVVLLRTDITAGDDFFAQVRERVAASPGKNAFVFVHGYNVTFENAARRTAQITFDLGFRGAPVFYSWPSQGETGKYTVDEQNIEWTETNLKRFLADFFERSDAESIYLVAHSMGNRGMTRALKALALEKPEIRHRLREIILTAPDIDAEVFKRDIAPALTAFERPVTLYASSEDVALKASKKVHGHPRAGDSGEQILIVPGIETVDATGTDTSFLRHSYFAEVESVLTDIFDLIRHRLRADQRERLEAIDTPQGRYWAFKN